MDAERRQAIGLSTPLAEALKHAAFRGAGCTNASGKGTCFEQEPDAPQSWCDSCLFASASDAEADRDRLQQAIRTMAEQHGRWLNGETNYERAFVYQYLLDRLKELEAVLTPAAVSPAKKRCENWAPATFSGHWREWHRGHGCELDPSAAASPASQEQP